MALLSINIDHVATVREARGINEPEPVLAAGLAELAGADGIICHLREDRRHINDRDLRILRETVNRRTEAGVSVSTRCRSMICRCWSRPAANDCRFA